MAGKPKLDLPPKNCLFCDKLLVRKNKEIANNWRDRKYCNYDCWYNRNTNKSKDCEYCGNLIRLTRRMGVSKFNKKRFCSIRCVVDWREQQYKNGKDRTPSTYTFPKGINNPNWNGGCTSEAEKIRKGATYKRWRKLVFDRDNYTCQICFKRGGDIEADHIKQFAYHPDLRFDINNGRTLCKKCHRETPTYGNNRKEQYA